MAPRRLDSNGRRFGGNEGLLGSLSRFWAGSYAPDYVAFTVLAVAYTLIQFFVDPFHRMFAVNDLRISFPHADAERVPLGLDLVYALFIPLLLLGAYLWATGASSHKHHVTVLGFAIALILTSTLTDIVKNAAGRPRPDLLARCKPRLGTPGDTLVTIAVCTEINRNLLQDGWRSFPSGHSSFSFAGLGYLSLFLAGQFRIFSHGLGRSIEHLPRVSGENRSGEASEAAASVALSGFGVGSPPTHAEKLVRGDLGLSLMCLTPLVGAVMIAISRVQDYRHDVYDVSVGAALGSVVAYWSYRRYWPRLGSARCDEPYASPPAAALAAVADVDGGGNYGRVRDEEEGNGGMGLDSVRV